LPGPSPAKSAASGLLFLIRRSFIENLALGALFARLVNFTNWPTSRSKSAQPRPTSSSRRGSAHGAVYSPASPRLPSIGRNCNKFKWFARDQGQSLRVKTHFFITGGTFAPLTPVMMAAVELEKPAVASAALSHAWAAFLRSPGVPTMLRHRAPVGIFCGFNLVAIWDCQGGSSSHHMESFR
jgi:hypothetical protein